MLIPHDIPAEAARILEELFGGEELAGFWFNQDFTRIQARVIVDGAPSTQVFEKDSLTGEYKLIGYSGLGRARL